MESILEDTPPDVIEEAPSDEEEEFKYQYRQNLLQEAGPVGTDLRYRWADLAE